MVDPHRAEHRHLRRRADLGVLGADRQRSATRVAEALGDAVGPGRELGPRPLEAVVAVAELPGRQRLEAHVVLAVRRRHDHRRRLRELEHARSKRRRRGGSRCSITSTTRRRVEARQAPVAVGQRAVQQLDPLALARRACRSSRRRRARSPARACDTSTPTISLELPVVEQPRSSLPSPQPRSSTRARAAAPAAPRAPRRAAASFRLSGSLERAPRPGRGASVLARRRSASPRSSRASASRDEARAGA